VAPSLASPTTTNPMPFVNNAWTPNSRPIFDFDGGDDDDDGNELQDDDNMVTNPWLLKAQNEEWIWVTFSVMSGLISLVRLMIHHGLDRLMSFWCLRSYSR
jgi:hypothetical protein